MPDRHLIRGNLEIESNVGVRQDTAGQIRHAYRPGMDILRRFSDSPASCDHVPDALPLPQAERCQECGSGFNLRLCATCGHVGCCESQRGDARAHALAEGHPVIYQMPAPKGFAWCYEEHAYVG